MDTSHHFKVYFDDFWIKIESLPKKGDLDELSIAKTNGIKDRFSGLTISSKDEYISGEKLASVLEASLNQWRSDGVRALWFKVDLQHADWVPILAKHGFAFHHAKADFVMMVLWLSANEQVNLPSYAHNMVGVGAFVVNKNDELLVVRERFYRTPHWKLPGGYVNPGEDIQSAAVREVKEETGIDAKFVSMVSFRHVHNANFGCSDLYFITHLEPASESITMCQRELAACEWMKLQEYIAHPHVHEVNRYFAKCFLENRERCVQMQSIDICAPGFNRTQTIYSVKFTSEVSEDIKSECEQQHNSDPKL